MTSHQDSTATLLAAGNQEWWTMPEVAAHYRHPLATIRYWRHSGYGPKGVKVGTRVLYAASEIDRFDKELAAAAQGTDEARSAGVAALR